jgi:hypothetical protein
MYLRNILFILVLFILCSSLAFAQQDSVKRDSTRLYKSIESYSKKSKFKGFIYQLLFEPVPVPVKETKKEKSKPKIKSSNQNTYAVFEGKIIRNIEIQTLDPFGYSVSDTSKKGPDGILKSANSIHVKTQRITIQNYLLFRKNQQFDSLLVRESERLIRTSKYIHEVHFQVELSSKNSDSVDIFIREQDSWSLIPGVSASPSHFTFVLTETNFVGLGHETKDGFTWYHNTGDYAYNLNYIVPNIKNTYINTTIHYDADEYGNINRVFAVDRPFFSPFAKWAAGIALAKENRNDSIDTSDPLFVNQLYVKNAQDYWAGNAIQLNKGNTEANRTTSFISTLRLLRIRYDINTDPVLDTLRTFSNQTFYMSGFGIARRNYERDKYLFKFGVTEDVPVGEVYSVTIGYREKYKSGNVYLGGRISLGDYYSFGYLSASVEYGTYFRSSHAEQGLVIANMTYFTNVWETGKWKIRQFIKPRISIGINETVNDRFLLNASDDINYLNSLELNSHNLMEVSFQIQTYSPWNLIGFHFGPFLNYSIGISGDGLNGFSHSRAYSKIGLGVLIKNDNLVLNTFQLSITFYPINQGDLNNVFKVNGFKTTDFVLGDFVIGKPSPIN